MGVVVVEVVRMRWRRQRLPRRVAPRLGCGWQWEARRPPRAGCSWDRILSWRQLAPFRTPGAGSGQATTVDGVTVTRYLEVEREGAGGYQREPSGSARLRLALQLVRLARGAAQPHLSAG